MRVLVRFVAALVLLTAAVGGAALVLTHRALDQRFKGFEGPETVISIEPGTSVRDGLALLEAEGVIRDSTLARLYWRFSLKDPVLMAGEYAFREPSSTPEVLNKIVRGDVLTHRVTLLEGLTLEEVARHLADEGFGSYDAFLAEMASPRRIEDFDGEAPDLEGYLFPDTYWFARGTSESRIVDTLVAAFRKHFQEAREANPPTGLPESDGSPRLSLSPRQIVILASIVEKEALRDDERPIIAGVYSNRLEIGMGLYADPTIIYALKRNGTWDGNLRRRDLEMDSPYNTYRSQGLPPGPICSPGLASLSAAMAPADVPYLYFVSRNDGTHVFARTLAEHNRNVHKWQKLYWQKRWAEEAQREELH